MSGISMIPSLDGTGTSKYLYTATCLTVNYKDLLTQNSRNFFVDGDCDWRTCNTPMASAFAPDPSLVWVSPGVRLHTYEGSFANFQVRSIL